MSDISVEDFPIPGLEFVFYPPGLPLITKTTDAPATTSVLIRGGAGTGKTTLAVAIAHAVAREQGGVALYLSTEFVATELVYKASTLGLSDDSVNTWDSREGHEPGTILAEHLLRTRVADDRERLVTVAHRKRAAIDAIWELLAPSEQISAELATGRLVRVVVIDAFGLPEVEQEDGSLRNELLELVQALELVGITVILVEEAGARSEAWLPFVVDVVFEIHLLPDPDTGDLLRKLKCPKSRYASSLPGPHDYGLDTEGLPSLWPDLTFFPEACGLLDNEKNHAPAIFLPGTAGGAQVYALCPTGSVMVSGMGTAPILHGVIHTPGLKPASVKCGPMIDVKLFAEASLTTIAENQGLFAVAWELIWAYHRGAINSVFIVDLEFFTSRARQRIYALRMIAMLSAVGISVCVSERHVANSAVRAMADFVQGGEMRNSVRVELEEGSPCRADRWIVAFEELVGPVPATDSTDYGARRQMLNSGAPVDVGRQLDASPGLAKGDVEGSFQRALSWHFLGQFSKANQHLQLRKGEKASAVHLRALFLFLMGDGPAAAAAWLSEPKQTDLREIWTDLSAIYARNDTALEWLAAANPVAHFRRAIAFIRASARAKRFEQLAEFVESCGERYALPDWFKARLRADAYLDVDDLDCSRKALEALNQLTEDDTIPVVHRAEIFYNLGIAKRRLRDHTGTSEAFARARELNPLLELSSPSPS